jgi:hypothetical protein
MGAGIGVGASTRRFLGSGVLTGTKAETDSQKQKRGRRGEERRRFVLVEGAGRRDVRHSHLCARSLFPRVVVLRIRDYPSVQPEE